MTVVLLDANNLAMRSFHAAKHQMTAADGTETGSVHLFATGLSRHLAEIRPDAFVACWDGGGQSFRHQLYPQYKAARRGRDEPGGEPSHLPAFRLIGEYLDLVGLGQWRQPGVEADDLIAAAWRRTRDERPDQDVVILSADKDLLQLLDGRTTQIRFSSYNTPTDVWTRERVITEFGYTPEQIPTVMAFTGDQSDGVPGAKGIGPVKAVKLLRAHDWNFVKAMESLPDRQMVLVSRVLVDLLDDVNLPQVPPVPEYAPLTRWSPDATERLSAFTEFCAQYQLRTLWERLVEGHLW